MKNQINPQEAVEALCRWWRRDHPAASTVHIADFEVPASNGLSSETVLFKMDWSDEGGAEHVEELALRMIPRDGQVFPTYSFTREAHAMTTVRAHTNAPAPRVVAIEDDDEILGAPFLVMERLNGRVLPDDPPFTVDSWFLNKTETERAVLVNHAIAALTDLHRAPIDGFDPETLGHPSRGADPMRQHLDYWRDLYSQWGQRFPHPTIEAGFDYLDSNQPRATANCLSWGDARLGNFMFDENGAVSGVLDWEMVALGPRELDVSWFFFINRFFTDGIGVPVPAGLPSRTQVIERYEEASGVSLQNLDYYETFNAVRVSVIMLRLGALMIDHGLIPPDASIAFSNPASHLLAGFLELPPPTGEAQWVAGKR